MVMNSYFLLFLFLYGVSFIGIIILDVQVFGTKKQKFADFFVCGVLSFVVSAISTGLISIIDAKALSALYCIFAFVAVTVIAFYTAKVINKVSKKLED